MVGNFEIVPRIVVFDGIEYVISGYHEGPNGTRLANAVFRGRSGVLREVKSIDLKIILMKRLEYENKRKGCES